VSKARLIRAAKLAAVTAAVTAVLTILTRSSAVMRLVGTISIAVTLISPVLPSDDRSAGAAGDDDWAKALFRASRESAERRQSDLLGGQAEPYAVEPWFIRAGSPSGWTAPGAAGPCSDANQDITLDELVAAASIADPGRLVIRGDAGSGKTVAATLLTLRLLKQQPAHNPRRPVPVLVSVAGWTGGEPFPDWLARRVATEYPVARTVAAALIRDGHVLPVLDGLDELGHDESGQHRGIPFLDALTSWRRYDDPSPAVITCRAAGDNGLENAIRQLRNTTQVRIQALQPGQVRGYVHDRLAASPSLPTWQAVLEQARSPGGAGIRRLLSVPWQLYLAVTLSQAQPARWPGALLPRPDEDAAAAERRIRDELLAEYVHAAVRLTPWPGERHRPAATDTRSAQKAAHRTLKVQRWLRAIAALPAQQAAADRFPEEDHPVPNGTDIVPHLLWEAAGTSRARVVNCLLGLAAMWAALVAVPVVFAPFPTSAVATGLASAPGLAAIIAAYSSGAVVIASVAWMLFGSRWPRLHIGTRPGTALSPRAVAGWLWNAIQSRYHGHGFVYSAQVTLALIRRRNLAEARAAVQRRQDRALWSPAAALPSPMAALRAYPRYVLALAAAAATLAALAVTLAAVAMAGPGRLAGARGFPFSAMALEFLRLWLRLGISCLAAAVIYLAATPWARYIAGAAVAAVTPRSRLPVRLGRFLDWACTAGLLRQSGAVYQFRHQDLQEWLEKPGKPVRPARYASERRTQKWR
jgi:hypothetical protein